MLNRLLTFLSPKKPNLVGLSKELCGGPVRTQYWAAPKKKEDEEWVFCFDGRILGYPVAFQEAYADQKMCAFIQSQEPGAPALLFRTQIHPKRIQQIARLKGVIVRVPKVRMEFLDNIFRNTVDCTRRRTRVLLPLQKENGVMVNTPAWVYQDNPELWRDRFGYDYEHFRGRSQGRFQVAELAYNPRFPHIEKYYIHPTMKLEEGTSVNYREQNNRTSSTVS